MEKKFDFLWRQKGPCDVGTVGTAEKEADDGAEGGLIRDW